MGISKGLQWENEKKANYQHTNDHKVLCCVRIKIR